MGKLKNVAAVLSADESLLLVNDLLLPLGYLFKGYDYEELMNNRIEDILPPVFVSSLKTTPNNTRFVFGEEVKERDTNVLGLLKYLGFQSNFKSPSKIKKIYFFEQIEELEFEWYDQRRKNIYQFELITYRLFKILSIFCEYPVRAFRPNFESEWVGIGSEQWDKSFVKSNSETVFKSSTIDKSSLKELIKFNIENSMTIDYFPEEESNINKTNFSLTKHEYIDLSVGLYHASTSIPIKNLDLSVNLRTKLALLISSMESLFNTGSNHISHTISRHYALLEGNNFEFQENYAFMKYCYTLSG